MKERKLFQRRPAGTTPAGRFDSWRIFAQIKPMTIDRIFLAYMALCGLAAAAVVILFPHAAQLGVPPYFWVLIPMAVFEAIAFARGRGAPGTAITVWSRLIGFVIAIALMLAIPYLAGYPVVQLLG